LTHIPSLNPGKAWPLNAAKLSTLLESSRIINRVRHGVLCYVLYTKLNLVLTPGESRIINRVRHGVLCYVLYTKLKLVLTPGNVGSRIINRVRHGVLCYVLFTKLNLVLTPGNVGLKTGKTATAGGFRVFKLAVAVAVAVLAVTV
jgi:hypothetical protein